VAAAATVKPIPPGSCATGTSLRGGRLDGTLGVVAALEAARAIGAAGVSLDHPLEVVVFADEEGARFSNIGLTGTRALLGTLSAEEL
jgi:allantoate deiminase